MYEGGMIRNEFRKSVVGWQRAINQGRPKRPMSPWQDRCDDSCELEDLRRKKMTKMQ